MFTDVYFTGHAALQAGIAFYHPQVSAKPGHGAIFNAVRCPHGWTHRLRIFWELSYRLVRSPGNSSHPYALKHSYRQEQKQFLISKDGVLTVQQGFANGKQVISFEQTQGNPCSGIQVFRGKLLIAEQFFSGKQLEFQIENTVNVSENSEVQNDPALSFPLSGQKSIHIALIRNELSVIQQTYW